MWSFDSLAGYYNSGSLGFSCMYIYIFVFYIYIRIYRNKKTKIASFRYICYGMYILQIFLAL